MRAGRDGDATGSIDKLPLFESARVRRLTKPEDALAELVPEWLVKPFGSGHPEFMDSLEYPWRPVWPVPSPNFALYFELANRIACLYRLAEAHPRASIALFRWLDRYIPMAVYMQSMNRYDYGADELLAVWPTPEGAADADALPDIAMHILQAPHWGTDRDPPFQHPADRALVVILEKSGCAPCRSRGYGSITKKRLKHSYGRYLYDALARIVLVSLLGSSKHASVQACFQLRYRLYEWYCFSGSNRDLLLEWIERNPMLLTYCLREHVFTVAETLPTYERYMSQRRRWFSMRRNALNAMDEVRASLNEAFRVREMRAVSTGRGLRFSLDPPTPLISPLADYNDRNLQFSPRPMTDTLCEKMRKSFVAVDKDRSEPLPPPTDEEIDAMRDIEKLVCAYEPHQRFPYELLHRYFAVSYDSVRELELGEEAFLHETDRTRIRHALNGIVARSLRDYRLLRAYFDALRKAIGLVFGDLPYGIAERQIMTLRVQYGLSPGEPLPEAAGTFFVCPNCTFFKAKVQHDDSRRGKEVRTPIYDALTGKIFCRRLVPRQQAANKGGNDEASKARQEKKKNIEDACKYSELWKVNMVGRIAWSREQKASVFMCPGCSQLCTHGRHAFSGGVFGCGCDAKPERAIHACVVCSQRKIKMSWLTVADDRTSPTQIRSLAFCDKHFPRWSRRSHRFELLSDIKEMLRRGAFTVALHDDEGEEVDRIGVSRR